MSANPRHPFRENETVGDHVVATEEVRTFVVQPIAKHVKDVCVFGADTTDWARGVNSEFTLAPDIVCIHHPGKLLSAMELMSEHLREAEVFRAEDWWYDDAEMKEFDTEFDSLKGLFESILAKYDQPLAWWSDPTNRPWIRASVLEGSTTDEKKLEFFQKLEGLIPLVVCISVDTGPADHSLGVQRKHVNSLSEEDRKEVDGGRDLAHVAGAFCMWEDQPFLTMERITEPDVQAMEAQLTDNIGVYNEVRECWEACMKLVESSSSHVRIACELACMYLYHTTGVCFIHGDALTRTCLPTVVNHILVKKYTLPQGESMDEPFPGFVQMFRQFCDDETEEACGWLHLADTDVMDHIAACIDWPKEILFVSAKSVAFYEEKVLEWMCRHRNNQQHMTHVRTSLCLLLLVQNLKSHFAQTSHFVSSNVLPRRTRTSCLARWRSGPKF